MCGVSIDSWGGKNAFDVCWQNKEKMKYHNKNFIPARAMVLGMHDALVSLTGLIAGIAFTMPRRRDIVLTAIIASITASMSMAASNYLAEKAGDGQSALRAGLYTGAAYMLTCVVLIIPFTCVANRTVALFATFALAILIIFIFNWGLARRGTRHWQHRAFEMLGVCAGVSCAAFIIGQIATYFLGPSI